MKTRDVALTGVMIALTWVVTRAFIIPIPQTKGFFNVGEAAVYTAAILFGPWVGAVAGGVGSALADVSLGYTNFALFTLIIKGVEGYVVGALSRGTRRPYSFAGGLIGLLMGIWALSAQSWLVRAAGGMMILAGGTALYFLIRPRGGRVGVRVSAMIAGGLLMILGYFVTQAFIMRLGVPAALVEVPYNAVQMTIGILVGLLASASFEEAKLVPQR